MLGLFYIITFFILNISFIILTLGIMSPLTILWCLCIFKGAEKRIIKAHEKLKTILMDNEDIIASTLQKRPYALFTRRTLIAITNSRIILLKRRVLGGFIMEDIQWKDLKDAQLDENIFSNFFGSNLLFEYIINTAYQDYARDNKLPSERKTISINGIPNSEASKIYGKAQSEEQAWEEKRRIREIEEKRAVAGGVYMNMSPAPTENAPQSKDNSVVEELEKAKSLFSSNAISDAEYQELKSKILSKHY